MEAMTSDPFLHELKISQHVTLSDYRLILETTGLFIGVSPERTVFGDPYAEKLTYTNLLTNILYHKYNKYRKIGKKSFFPRLHFLKNILPSRHLPAQSQQ